eukprot:13357683-Ditylum_brightwellii.AAC.1
MEKEIKLNNGKEYEEDEVDLDTLSGPSLSVLLMEMMSDLDAFEKKAQNEEEHHQNNNNAYEYEDSDDESMGEEDKGRYKASPNELSTMRTLIAS